MNVGKTKTTWKGEKKACCSVVEECFRFLVWKLILEAFFSQLHRRDIYTMGQKLEYNFSCYWMRYFFKTFDWWGSNWNNKLKYNMECSVEHASTWVAKRTEERRVKFRWRVCPWRSAYVHEFSYRKQSELIFVRTDMEHKVTGEFLRCCLTDPEFASLGLVVFCLLSCHSFTHLCTPKPLNPLSGQKCDCWWR